MRKIILALTVVAALPVAALAQNAQNNQNAQAAQTTQNTTTQNTQGGNAFPVIWGQQDGGGR